jgi:hypothetical protein
MVFRGQQEAASKITLPEYDPSVRNNPKKERERERERERE